MSEPLGREVLERLRDCADRAWFSTCAVGVDDLRALLDSHERLERGQLVPELVDALQMQRERAEAAEREMERLRGLLLEIAEDASGDWSINPGLNSVQAVLSWRESAKEKA